MLLVLVLTADMARATRRAIHLAREKHIPLVVIGSGRANPAFGEAAEDYQQFWIEQSQALVGKSTHGFILAQESSHHLYRDAPGLVLDAIRQVVEDV